MGYRGPRLAGGSFPCVVPKVHTTCPQGGSCIRHSQEYLANEQFAVERNSLGRKETPVQRLLDQALVHCDSGP